MHLTGGKRGDMDNPVLFRNYCRNYVREVNAFLGRHRDWMSIEENQLVVDAYCGPGDLTERVLKPILPTSVKIVGCDPTPGYIEYANKNHTAPNVSYKVMDMQNDEFWNDWDRDSVDKIFSFYSMHRLIDQAKATANMSAILKPGGQLMMLFPTETPMTKILKGILQLPEYKEHTLLIQKEITNFLLWDEPTEIYTRILCSENFTNIGCSERHSTFTFPSLDCYLSMYISENPTIEELPVSKHDFIEDCRRIAEDKNLFVGSSEGVQCSYTIVEVSASKRTHKPR